MIIRQEHYKASVAKRLLFLFLNERMPKYFFLLALDIWNNVLTNLKGAQALGNKFPASIPRLIQEYQSTYGTMKIFSSHQNKK